MENRGTDNLPFVKLLLPAGAGIAVASFAPVGWGYFAAAAALLWLCACLFRNASAATVYTFLSVAFFFTAVASFCGQGPVVRIGPGDTVVAELIVTEEPAAGSRWSRATARVTAYRYPDPVQAGTETEWIKAGFNIQLYVDSTVTVAPGMGLVVRATFYPFSPDGGSYEALMLRRGVAGRMYAGPDGVLAVESSAGMGAGFAARLHNSAVRKFANLPRAGSAAGVSTAMVTGDKRFIPREVRQSYADGGGAHLLAVSGLHVGIVFVLVNLLLRYLPALRRGHIVKNLVAVAVVWLFAASAGLSPSVVRSALMFSFAQFALARGTLGSTLNLLAASALMTLAADPLLCRDPSFVLSYAAVLSIILFFPPVFKLIKSGNRYIDAVLSIYIVGVAASLAAAPFVSHWFGSVPLAGVLVNPLVIFTAHVIVAVGVLWLVWPFGFAGQVFGAVLGAAEGVQNRVMEWCAGLGWGMVEVSLPLGWAVTAYVLVVISALLMGRWVEERSKALSLQE